MVPDFNASTHVHLILLADVALLRFYKLGEWSFWGDAMLTVAGVADGFKFNASRQSLATFQYNANRYVFITLSSWLILAAIAVVELIRRSAANARWLAAGVLLLILLDPLAEAAL